MIMREDVPHRATRVKLVGFAVLTVGLLPGWSQTIVALDAEPVLHQVFAARSATGEPSPAAKAGDPFIAIPPSRASRQSSLQASDDHPQQSAATTGRIRLTIDDAVERAMERSRGTNLPLDARIVQFHVRSAYWGFVYGVEVLASATESMAVADKLVQDDRRRVETGTLAPIEVVSAQAEHARIRQTVVSAEKDLQHLERALKNIIGADTGDPVWASNLEPVDTAGLIPSSQELAMAARDASRALATQLADEAATATVALRRAAESVSSARAQREEAQRQFQLDEKNFEAGDATHYRVIQAMRRFIGARNLELDIALNFRAAQITFESVRPL